MSVTKFIGATSSSGSSCQQMVRGLESMQGGITYACSVLIVREGICFWLLSADALRLWEPLLWSSIATAMFQSLLILVIVNQVIWVCNSWENKYGSNSNVETAERMDLGFLGFLFDWFFSAWLSLKRTSTLWYATAFHIYPQILALCSQPELETRDGRHVCDSLLPDKVGMGVWDGKSDTIFESYLIDLCLHWEKERKGLKRFKYTFT